MKVADYAKAAAAGDALGKKLHSHVQTDVFGKGGRGFGHAHHGNPYYPATSTLGDSAPASTGQVKRFELVLTYPWNLMNRYPVVNVPVGMAKNMQVVGNTYDDHGALRVAAGYAKDGLRLYAGALFPDFRTMS